MIAFFAAGPALLAILLAQARGNAGPDGGVEPPVAAAPADAGTAPDRAALPDAAVPPNPASPPSAAPATSGPAAPRSPAERARRAFARRNVYALPVPSSPTNADEPVGTWELPHYDEGFVLVNTPEAAPMPYRLKLNHVSQFKYTNSLAVRDEYTTHLGVVTPVNKRNDFQLTRDVFYFSGYVFDERLDYNLILYTSTADLTATAAGYVGFVFNKAFALRAGFFSLPSLRAMTGTYPFFPGTDRSMEVNYMRPGFTQGVWANGELFPGFNYIAMVGNSLNTLNIAASRVDYRFAYSASVWYDLNDFGKPWNDYEDHPSLALRIGTAFTYAREDRLSDLSTASPENNSTYMSDGTLLFGTGTLAPNVTVSLASFYLYAIDLGLKYKGFAFNTEWAMRWLDNFEADGPLPLEHMFDWGFDASMGYFIIKKRWELGLRSSLVHGPFATAVEGAIGSQWYPFNTRQVWLAAEVIAIKNCPYTSALYIYSSGQTGFLFPAQLLVRF